MLQILGFRAPGKANLPGTLGRHCRDLDCTFRAGCLLTLTVPAFSSFSEFGGAVNSLLNIKKNPRVRKIFVRNSGAGNGCANFMDAWKNASALQEKPFFPIKFLILGGGGYLGFWGGGVPILFLWA